MERTIPNLNRPIVYPLIGHDTKNRKEEKYIEKLKKFERDCEKSLIKTFEKIGVQALVKTDPYSLPFKKEVVVTLNGESYMNGPYEFYRVARKIIKEVLNEDAYQLRFYMLINVLTDGPGFIGALGRVEYRFRYSVRTN